MNNSVSSARALQRGNCVSCGNARGEDGTKRYCRPCANLVAEGTAAWRKRNRQAGRCSTHAKPVTRFKHCHECAARCLTGSVQKVLPSPKHGEKLKSCIYCECCDRHYHEGNYYYPNDKHPRWKRGIQPGPNGSLFNFDERQPGDAQKALSLCGDCRGEGRDDWRYRNPNNWDGRCREHFAGARMESGDVTYHLPDGDAVVHRSEREREAGPRKRRSKVAFTCACATPEERAHGEHRSITYLSQTKSKTWRGLCPSCLLSLPVPNKILEDVTRGGVRIYFSRADEQGWVPVTYLICQHTKLVPRERASALNTDPPTRGICSGCVKSPAALAERLAELLAGRDGGVKNGVVEKAKRGRKAGDKIINYEDFIDALKACTREELAAVHHCVTEVQQTAVLARYHNKYPNDGIALSTLRSRLNGTKYKMKWPKFVELVAKEVTAS